MPHIEKCRTMQQRAPMIRRPRCSTMRQRPWNAQRPPCCATAILNGSLGRCAPTRRDSSRVYFLCAGRLRREIARCPLSLSFLAQIWCLRNNFKTRVKSHLYTQRDDYLPVEFSARGLSTSDIRSGEHLVISTVRLSIVFCFALFTFEIK